MTGAAAASRTIIRKAREQAAELILHHLRRRPRRIVHRTAGQANLVFEVDAGGERLVVRIGVHPDRIDAFIKEQWVIERVREAGVPAPEILEVGSDVIQRPYLIARCVPGRGAIHHPARLGIVRGMGEYAARIHRIATSGFGRTFDWSANRLSRNETWKGFLHREFGVEARLAVLERAKMVTGERMAALVAAVGELERLKRPPRLNHGDLRLKNVMVDDAGTITAIIDWEACLSSVAPQWDLAIALHDLPIDARHELLEGYGLSHRQVVEMAPVLKALNLLHYAPYVDRAAAAGDRDTLEQYRLRFSGALDLYTL
jgi:hygromycin-B 4-O-kinase